MKHGLMERRKDLLSIFILLIKVIIVLIVNK